MFNVGLEFWIWEVLSGIWNVEIWNLNIYIFFPTLDAGLPLGEGVRGAAAQLTYMADMGVISIEEARRRMRVLYAVRASRIYGNLNHLDNDFVSYMVWYIMLWRRCKTSSDDFLFWAYGDFAPPLFQFQCIMRTTYCTYCACYSIGAPGWRNDLHRLKFSVTVDLKVSHVNHALCNLMQFVHHHASWSGPAVTPYSPTSPIDAGEQAEKTKEDEDSNVDWVNWASLEKWLEIMGASDSLRRCKISLINYIQI